MQEELSPEEIFDITINEYYSVLLNPSPKKLHAIKILAQKSIENFFNKDYIKAIWAKVIEKGTYILSNQELTFYQKEDIKKSLTNSLKELQFLYKKESTHNLLNLRYNISLLLDMNNNTNKIQKKLLRNLRKDIQQSNVNFKEEAYNTLTQIIYKERKKNKKTSFIPSIEIKNQTQFYVELNYKLYRMENINKLHEPLIENKILLENICQN